MRKRCNALLSVLLCALLCACSAGNTTEELLRAPQTTPELSAVQRALNSYLGESLQLKYPRGGTEASPILFSDLDGDGQNEAVVLYLAASKGQNVHMAILESTDGAWVVAADTAGLSTEVAAVQTASLLQGGTQLIISYANATLTDPFIAVYAYENEAVTRLLEQSYLAWIAPESYGLQDLFLVSNPASAGSLHLQWYKAQDGALTQVQNVELDGRFLTCTGLYPSRSGTASGIVVEGAFASGAIANQIFRIQQNALTEWPDDEAVHVPDVSMRNLTRAHAIALVREETICVPTGVAPAVTLLHPRRFYLMQWQDYLGEQTVLVAPESTEEDEPPGASSENEPAADEDAPPELIAQVTLPDPYFGAYDSTYGFFVRLPLDWKGAVRIVDGSADNEWQVRSKDGNALLVSIRVTDNLKTIGTYTRVGTVDKNDILLYCSSRCTTADAAMIRGGVRVFE